MQVHCSHDAIVDIADLKPNPRNYNKHSDKQIAMLAKNIRKFGWRHPIIVSKRSNFIVSGHARLEAGKLLNCGKIPVNYQDYANEQEEIAVLIADNRIAELAEPDQTGLKDLLQEIDTGDFDMELTGFDTNELEQMMTELVPEPKDDESKRCPNCGTVIQ